MYVAEYHKHCHNKNVPKLLKKIKSVFMKSVYNDIFRLQSTSLWAISKVHHFLHDLGKYNNFTLSRYILLIIVFKYRNLKRGWIDYTYFK